MAGSIVVTSGPIANGAGIYKYGIAWTSDASGVVSVTPFAVNPGTIVLVEFVPGSGGTTPTDLYDVMMTDDLGVNVLGDGAGGSIGTDSLAASATSKVPLVIGATGLFVRRWLHGGNLIPVVAAAGNAKTGLINLYVAPGVI